MTTREQPKSEAERLERLWSGDFGDAYVDRNRAGVANRGPFWHAILEELSPKSVLEIGCNLGGNLAPIAEVLPPAQVFGIDVNQKALDELHRRAPGVNAVTAAARDLPFRDRWFDLVFTMGVLIHQPPEMLPLVMAEIVRCSRRWILCGEYFAEEPTEVPYRGQTGALFKRDFGRTYRELFPNLTLRRQGFLSRAEGWDDITYWIFEKQS